MSSTIFGLQSSYIPGYHWLFTLFLRSAKCFTLAQGEVDSTPTYLTAIFQNQNVGILRVKKRIWHDHWYENLFWDTGWERNIISIEWRQVVEREKIKFKITIRGKKKVKWGNRQVEQNMIIEINYNIKSSDLIYMHNLEGQERNVKKKHPTMQERKYCKSWRRPWWNSSW